ncbi:MAG: chloride channel protein [Bacteroidales bacterium]|nr:chloride channel protein [Bacteroidales bacterium]
MSGRQLLKKFLIWRIKHVNERVFISALAILTGVVTGLVAVVIKNSVHLIQDLLKGWFSSETENFLFMFYPIVGITLAVIVARYLIRQRVGHGIPTVLYSISKTRGEIRPHNMFSSIITSALTVGFGGSVGLEGPTVATGAAYGSRIGKLFHLKHKHIILLLGCASTGAMAAIFKAPVAAIVFALEVIMLDLTMASLVPLLLASAAAVITSYLFMGQNVLYPVQLVDAFQISHLHFYAILGVFTGLMSVYFTKMYMYVGKAFQRINSWIWKLVAGGLILGLLIFLMPSLYGEGYEVINGALSGKFDHLFENTFYYNSQSDFIMIVLAFFLILFFKVIATSVTFNAGGVGGIFAPSLFLGSNLGLMFSIIVNKLGWKISLSNFALVGMAGSIAGIIHAPLTAIFLIAEITGGYELFLPLIIVAAISYATVRIFTSNSVYTKQLAKRGELLTHNADKNMLSMLKLESLIEKNFLTINEEASLGDLTKIISKSSRTIYVVVDEQNVLKGIVWLDHVKHLMFRPELYDNTFVRDLMYMPVELVETSMSVQQVAEIFETTQHYNLPVVDNGKYIGFVSRAKVFSNYRKKMKHYSND